VNLVVNDSTFVSDSDSVIITVLPVPNEAPVAEAGTDQSVLVGDEVVLDGSGSTDPDGDTLTYAWTLTGPDGSTATLADATTATPSFTPDLAGEYAATLVVNDGTVDSTPDTVTISATLPTIAVSSLELPTYGSGNLRVTLERPAGPGGLVLALASDNTLVVAPPSTVTVAACEAVIDVPLESSTAAGTAVLTSSADALTSGVDPGTVPERTTNLARETMVAVPRTSAGTVVLDEPAPAGGVTVSRASSNTALVTVTASTVQNNAGESSAAFEVPR